MTNVPGSISNISIANVHAVDVHGSRGNWTSTFDGMPVDLAANVKRVYPVGQYKCVRAHSPPQPPGG